MMAEIRQPKRGAEQADPFDVTLSIVFINGQGNLDATLLDETGIQKDKQSISSSGNILFKNVKHNDEILCSVMNSGTQATIDIDVTTVPPTPEEFFQHTFNRVYDVL